jgi:hypothetical protein
MTITIDTNQFDFYINTPNLSLSDVIFDIKSQLSNTLLVGTTATITDSNERYSTISVTLNEDIADKHYNGIYEYTVYSNENIYDTGLLKIVTEPGGTTGTIDYQSNNEDRQAKVIYRPAYE